jgi:hypothetical protein
MMLFKQILKRASALGVEINYSLDHGLSLFGMNVSRARHRYAPRGNAALRWCCSLAPKTVLDVGSGGGQHAAIFAIVSTR